MDAFKKLEANNRPFHTVIPFRAPTSCKVYTPVDLASALVSGVGVEDSKHWLEPSFGRGAFLKALSSFGVRRDHIVAVDVDRHPSELDDLGTALRGTEFLGWALHHQFKFDRIVGNPPYVAIERVNSRLQALAASLSWEELKGVGFNGNLWAAFIIACLRLLQPHANMSFVLPAAWDYADYAEQLRNKLPFLFSRFVVHRCRETLFSGVQDGCVVIQALDFGGRGSGIVRFEHKSAADLRIAVSDTSGTDRHVFNVAENVGAYGPHVPARSIFNIRLGGVTGDASFFLLRDSKRKRLGIPTRACIPALSRAKHLRSAFADRSTWTSLMTKDERVWLFRPTVKQAKSGPIKNYLRLDKKKGGCDRNADWVNRRKPWYRVMIPSRIDGFISGTSSFGPWICLNDMPRLAATNTLYVVQFLSAKTSANQRASWCIALLTSGVQAQLKRIARVYAGGMVKFEPSDLLSLSLPIPSTCKGAVVEYRSIIEMLMRGERRGATKAADAWFDHRSTGRII
jgi:adenine-specific DNA-methyltransferase